MILVTYDDDGLSQLGVQTDQGILDVSAANYGLNIEDVPDSPYEFFDYGLEALPALQALVEQAMRSAQRSEWLLPENTLRYLPCVPRPGKIICVGLNYRKHAQESKLEVPPVPVLFSKYQNALAACGEPVPLPPGAVKYDYEAELAVVIGKQARYVSEDDALDYVLGYCNANDVSARELQGMTSQWLLGKSLDKFLPLGPYLMTADQAGDPQSWAVRCWLNGELRQNSNTADMIFSVRQLVSFISKFMTLEPGDVISTGTPEGVILGKPSPRTWMKAGDEMVVEVGPLGKLTNQLVVETL